MSNRKEEWYKFVKRIYILGFANANYEYIVHGDKGCEFNFMSALYTFESPVRIYDLNSNILKLL